ncbi:MAG: hypothetical protein R6T92_10380 [Desulfosalsimonadaceae bacterium]
MKFPDKNALVKWLADAKEKYTPDELPRFLAENKERFEEYIAFIDGNKVRYRSIDWIFSLFSRLAAVADRISTRVQFFFLKIPGLQRFVQNFRGWKNHLNFQEMIAFVKVKFYSLRNAPHNEKAIQAMDDFMNFAASHGMDFNKHFPEMRRQFVEKKNQLMQHKFFREFSKSRLEQLLAIPFSFNRCIFPVLPDSAFWHKFFEYQERKQVIDIVLVDRSGGCVSFRHDDAESVRSSEVVRILRRISAIKAAGRRIFFIGHHEGYLGPYFVRSVLRKLGFDNLAKNCNTIVGPRMFSNLVLRNGAANVGNLFVTVPSQKTTAIRTEGLAEALQQTSRKTRCLIKLPDAGLMLIETLDYDEFMASVVHGNGDAFQRYSAQLQPEKASELKDFLNAEDYGEVMGDFTRQDFELFKTIMRECFLLFPEGSRSHIGPDGEVIMKHVNPKYMAAYMRPGDYIAPVNLVGGSDLARGWRLRPARLGISLDDPFEVTAEMIHNYREEGLAVMRKIAALPNIKPVRFEQEADGGEDTAR